MSQAKLMMNEWLQHRRILQELLESIGDEHLHYKPYDNAMELGELALHISGWNDVFVNLVKTEEFTAPSIPKCESMDDVRKAVEDFTTKTIATFETITDAELESPNSSSHPKLQGPKSNYLIAMKEHEIHHKGQLYIYARMVGVKEVPFFR